MVVEQKIAAKRRGTLLINHHRAESSFYYDVYKDIFFIFEVETAHMISQKNKKNCTFIFLGKGIGTILHKKVEQRIHIYYSQDHLFGSLQNISAAVGLIEKLTRHYCFD